MKPYRPYLTILYLSAFSGMTYMSIRENDTSMMIIIGIMYFILWLYCFITNLLTDYVKESNKIVWTISLIFLPPTAILFDDIKSTLKIEKKEEEKEINYNEKVINI
ncbi:hypothetical protein [Arcobacter sp. F2176]|uniref:hypothetical protein n=1 Tax=Arcobacter sp. F2176 TaxID=2044511 RepID=UPI00100A87DB|nr:hypothetical protein [Arcobacter sp. F2176]RXJ82632.1 hypothetical protein CRU95_00785 [Arcobacter sp. F2176]